MSSHATVVIRDPHREVWLYRHYDGYLASCGADVVEIAARVTQGARDLPTAGDVANEFRRILYPAEADCPARPVYELTDGRDFVEDYYLIDLAQRTIGYASRPAWDSDKRDREDWTADPPHYTVQEFVRLVNGERAVANERIAHLKRVQPLNVRIQAMRPLAMVSVQLHIANG
jgi:hypothetical protein